MSENGVTKAKYLIRRQVPDSFGYQEYIMSNNKDIDGHLLPLEFDSLNDALLFLESHGITNLEAHNIEIIEI